MCQLALGHFFLHGNHKPSDVWFDTDTLIRTFIDFQRRYRFDGFLINLPGRPAGWKRYLADYQQSDQGETLTWKSGLVTRIPPDDNPHTFQGDGGPLPRTDYATVDPLDPATYRAAGYVWNTWHAPDLWDIPADADLTDPAVYPDWFTRGLRGPRGVPGGVGTRGDLFALYALNGAFRIPPLVDGLARCAGDLSPTAGDFRPDGCRPGQCYARCEPDAILISSAFAGAGFISREMYREFVLPYEKQVVEIIRQSEIPVYTHTCGAIGDRLDLMAATGIDGIDTLDPPPLGTVDFGAGQSGIWRAAVLQGESRRGARDASGRRRDVPTGRRSASEDGNARLGIHPLFRLLGGPSRPAATSEDDDHPGRTIWALRRRQMSCMIENLLCLVIQCENIPWRSSFNAMVVRRRDDIPAIGAEDVDDSPGFVPHLLFRTPHNGFIEINSAKEHQILAELPFQVHGIHARRGDLNRIKAIQADFNQIGNDGPDGSAGMEGRIKARLMP